MLPSDDIVLTCRGQELPFKRAPSGSGHRGLVGRQLHDRLTRTPHIQNLHVGPVHVESRHIIRVVRVEAYPQQRLGQRSGRWGGRYRRWNNRLGRRRFVQDRRVLKAPEIKSPQASIRPDGNENVRRSRQPRDVVHLSIVRDELSYRLGGIDVPNRARRVDRRSDDETGSLLVPREVGQRSTRVLILHFRLLWHPNFSSRMTADGQACGRLVTLVTEFKIKISNSPHSNTF